MIHEHRKKKPNQKQRISTWSQSETKCLSIFRHSIITKTINRFIQLKSIHRIVIILSPKYQLNRNEKPKFDSIQFHSPKLNNHISCFSFISFRFRLRFILIYLRTACAISMQWNQCTIFTSIVITKNYFILILFVTVSHFVVKLLWFRSDWIVFRSILFVDFTWYQQRQS